MSSTCPYTHTYKFSKSFQYTFSFELQIFIRIKTLLITNIYYYLQLYMEMAFRSGNTKNILATHYGKQFLYNI